LSGCIPDGIKEKANQPSIINSSWKRETAQTKFGELGRSIKISTKVGCFQQSYIKMLSVL